MNINFTTELITQVEFDSVMHLSFRGVRIAKFADGAGRPPIQQQVDAYLKTYGYLAEYRRRWLLKEFEPGTTFVNWTEDVRVVV